VSQQQLFKGTYVFKQNGIEIGRSDNLITSNGRKMIMQYLAGARLDWATDLAIGALNTTPSLADMQLNFETGRYPVILKTYIAANATTGDPDLIVVRATIPENIYSNIYEIGLYATSKGNSQSSGKNNLIISDMSDLQNWSTSTGGVSTNQYTPQGSGSPRTGQYSINMSPNSVYKNNSLNLPFSNYSAIDSLQLLLSNTTAGNVAVKLTDAAGYTQTINFTLTNNTGYYTLSKLFDQSIGASPDAAISNFNYLSSIQITTNSTAGMTIDAIKAQSNINPYVSSCNICIRTQLKKTS
jgi:hypothetical protein